MNMASGPFTDVGLAFVSGCGQSDTHSVALSNGQPNPHQTAGTPDTPITGREIAAMVKAPPASVPKSDARCFIPSDYRDHDARSHDVLRARGRFHGLALDVDKNSVPMQDVREAVLATLGACPALFYSTSSAMPDNHKWQVLVPLRDTLAGADYGDTQGAFVDLPEEASAGALVPDRALERPAQLIYLPSSGLMSMRAGWSAL